MVFPSIEFAVFFPAVLALSWLLMPHPRLWKHVYWLLVPQVRDADVQPVTRAVNAAVLAAAAPFRAQVRVLDLPRILTPAGRFRAAMDVGGRETIVRDPDGIHLNDAGAEIAADLVERALNRDFS